MEGYFSFAVVLIGLVAAIFITRKDTAKNNSLSKKGIIKLSIILAICFISVVTEVFITPESWL